LTVVGIILAAGCGQPHEDATSIHQGEGTMQVTSSAFREGETIPRKYTGDGEDQSPPLQWSGVPEAAKSLALISDDPDAPRGTWVHWVLFNLPADTRQLPEGLSPDKEVLGKALQGTTDFRKIGYGGPAPPPGKPHRYYFKVYALDMALNLKAGATKQDLIKAMEGHILAEGQLMGKYGR
jgi:Raf kinase inhibitor-like YbhB/YbcL family protein